MQTMSGNEVGTRQLLRRFFTYHQIVIVDESGVAEEVRHDELIAAGGIYRRLHTAQFGSRLADTAPA